jgi:putative sporulation protein YyaC
MDSTLTVRSGDPSVIVTLSTALAGAITAREGAARPIVFACIGTDRSTGDALGPLVGQKLIRLGCSEREVLGTLERPLHALNLGERLAPVLGSGARPLVIAVDAALGASANVGTIALRPGGLRPGQGVGKDLPEVGELSLTATVNVAAGTLDAQVLQSTRLFLVQEMAETIGTACWWAVRSARRAGAGRRRETAPVVVAA